MRFTRPRLSTRLPIGTLALLFTAAGTFAIGAEPVASVATDRPQNDEGYAVTYSPHAASDDCHTNLGPTGARAWLRGYQLVVTTIQQGSPAHEKLMLGDVILSANGQTFGPDVDPRIALGNAITDAERAGAPLQVEVLRKGVRQEVKIDLPQLGAYAPTWPMNCEKSKAILDAACRSLVDSQMPNGGQVTDGSMGTFLSGMLLLGSGDPRYQDAARRAAYKAAAYDYESFDHNNWSLGYGGVLLAEYYLATGDDSVLPKLAEVADKIAKGQMLCGSWGHKSPAGGYGAVNQTGLVTAITLVLAKEAGVPVDEAAMNKSLEFFARFGATGTVPYGDHQPYNALDNNGAGSSAAVLFHLAGREKEAKQFAASVAESYWMREEGHTGAFFSILFGPMAASLAGEEKLRTFLDYQKWYYELCREWTGGVTFLPYKEALTRFDSSGYIYFGPEFTTGGMALVYAMPQKKMRILGAQPSVFGTRIVLPDSVKKARDLYVARDWAAFDTAIAAIDVSTLDADAKRGVEQLRDARALNKASTDHVLIEIESNLQDGAVYRASEQLAALKPSLGEQADPRLAELESRFAESTVQWYVREGKRFYERWEAIQGMTVLSWVPAGPQAKYLLEGVPSARLPIWEPLSPGSQIKPQTWRTQLLDKDATPADGWEQPGFDDTAWHVGEGIQTRFQGKQPDASLPAGPVVARRRFEVADPTGEAIRVRLRTVRNAQTKVYLNGKLIVDVERGQRGGYASILLQDRAIELLKKGENVLAVVSSAQGPDANRLDVALEVCRVGANRRHLPIDRATQIATGELPEGETSLQVARTADAVRAKLKQEYLDKPVEALLNDMGLEIGYYRGLAEDALVAKGLAGVKAATGRMGDENWLVRSAAVNVVRKAIKKANTENDAETLSFLAGTVPAVAERVKDDHMWVRTLACQTLDDLGPAAKDAVGLLVEATGDPEEWVRSSSLLALIDVGADADTLHKAAIQAQRVTNSSYSVARSALKIAQLPDGDAARKLDIVVGMIQTPPEGDGGTSLADAMTMGCKLDPDGKVMIPLLIDAASDKTGLGRQRGNPRGKAIELLGAYGPKAAAARETLLAVLADDSKPAQTHHTAATAALKAIGD